MLCKCVIEAETGIGGGRVRRREGGREEGGKEGERKVNWKRGGGRITRA